MKLDPGLKSINVKCVHYELGLKCANWVIPDAPSQPNKKEKRVFLPHASSSLKSLQSGSVSHCHDDGIHWKPSLQANWIPARQLTVHGRDKKRFMNINNLQRLLKTFL